MSTVHAGVATLAGANNAPLFGALAAASAAAVLAASTVDVESRRSHSFVAFDSDLKALEARVSAVEKRAAIDGAKRFRALFEAAAKGDQDALAQLQQHDTEALVTRLVVRTEEEFENQLANPSQTRLNPLQVVFVTPAASWVKWLGEARGHASTAASALDFVGWEKAEIEWAQGEGKCGRIYVWVDEEAAGCAGTWDLVFDRLLPECAVGAADFLASTVDSRPSAGWSDDAAENERFVAMARGLRREVEEVADVKDTKVGVPEALAATSTAEAPLKVRQCLRNLMYLGDLFAGDGWTRNKAGERKAAEMIVETRCLSDLDGLEVIDLGKV